MHFRSAFLVTSMSFLAAVGMIAIAPPLVAAAPASDVWDGVYTDAQSRRGANLYLDHCSECHAEDLSGKSAYNESPPLAGVKFRTRWDTKTLDELFSFIRTTMPKLREGGLKADEYIDIVAFLLQSNRFPASNTNHLPMDPEVLRTIRLSKERAR